MPLHLFSFQPSPRFCIVNMRPKHSIRARLSETEKAFRKSEISIFYDRNPFEADADDGVYFMSSWWASKPADLRHRFIYHSSEILIKNLCSHHESCRPSHGTLMNVELSRKTCACLIKINYENVRSTDTKHQMAKRPPWDPDELSVNQINESQSGSLMS